jgi:hypothetical protein
MLRASLKLWKETIMRTLGVRASRSELPAKKALMEN